MSEFITISHGTGGKETEELIKKLFVETFKLKSVKNGIGLDYLDDGSTIPTKDGQFVFTMDSFTIKPLFFSGGNIGKLAATGTINDIAVMGGLPLAVLDSIIVEEGVKINVVERVVDSFRKVLEDHNVALLGGDFKVMPKKSLDTLVITVAGIGFAEKVITDRDLKPGDKIIISGPIAEHGATILAEQMGLDPSESKLKSDCKPIIDAVRKALELGAVHAAKDPTRGGLANALNEFAYKSNVGIKIYEENIPIRDEVLGLCEMLGVDPLYLASEGQVVMSVKSDLAEELIGELKKIGYGDAAIIGEVLDSHSGKVLMETVIGGLRIVESPVGVPLPRIC
ncbi:MAG: hydrogenase expression/formation protein HypE [Candidatus Njordarchaeia archaeon]